MINAKWEVSMSEQPETKDFRLDLSPLSTEHSVQPIEFFCIAVKAERRRHFSAKGHCKRSAKEEKRGGKLETPLRKPSGAKGTLINGRTEGENPGQASRIQMITFRRVDLSCAGGARRRTQFSAKF